MGAEWEQYRRSLWRDETLGAELDVSRVAFPEGFLEGLEPRLQAAYAAMAELESGAIANRDEGRRVGHYWLRDPDRAPEPELAEEIRETRRAVERFAAAVRSGDLRGAAGRRFRNLLLIGIGGSALGPQLIADALRLPGQELRPFFMDNTDPEGFARVLAGLGGSLGETLTLVVSKSGGTRETRNGMLVAAEAYRCHGLAFSRHAVAVTGRESELDRHAAREGWLARFPMWDWVGGRTSVCSAVGTLPGALMGVDISGFLAGAAAMDAHTRRTDTQRNPAALLAAAWFYLGEGQGRRDMVVLPYRDRLALLAKYLQQLVMESLGKELDRAGNTVRQGLVVYGNKGSTDQHAYVQQLRDGPDNYFAVFVETRRETGPRLEVEPGVTAGDYLHGFLEGTRRALAEKGHRSVTITLERLDAASLGALIALFERAVGLYAELIDINAYHQPGVEAGKAAAARVLELQRLALAWLREQDAPVGAEEVARAIDARAEETETVYRLLRRLSADPDRRVLRSPAADPGEETFRVAPD